MKKLKIALTSHRSLNDFDNKLSSVFRDCLSYVKEKNSEFPFDNIELINFSYSDEPNLLSENSIATLSPITYIVCKAKLTNKIIPLGIVKKAGQLNPYFPAFFVANTQSGIKSIHSPLIKRIYLVSKNSTSGFIAPLYRLCQCGVISTPNEDGIKKIGWETILVGSHTEVLERVNDDQFAIGATGQFEDIKIDMNPKSQIISRYYYLPQDVFIISENLQPYKKHIVDWLNLHLNLLGEDELYNVLSKSSKEITGFEIFNDEYENAYDELNQMYVEVINPSPKIYPLIPTDPNEITLKELFNLFASLKTKDAWKLVTSVVAIISAIAVAAYKIGLFANTHSK